MKDRGTVLNIHSAGFHYIYNHLNIVSNVSKCATTSLQLNAKKYQEIFLLETSQIVKTKVQNFLFHLITFSNIGSN